MVYFWKLAVLSILAMCAFSSQAFALPKGLLGTWENTDPATRGVVRIIIDGAGKGGIKVFGACHPTPCDWGREELAAYGDSVSDFNHRVVMAHFSPGHAEQFVVARVLEDQTLQLQTFTRFTDSSERENYSKMELFQKVNDSQEFGRSIN